MLSHKTKDDIVLWTNIFFSFAMGVFGIHEFDVNFAVEIA